MFSVGFLVTVTCYISYLFPCYSYLLHLLLVSSLQLLVTSLTCFISLTCISFVSASYPTCNCYMFIFWHYFYSLLTNLILFSCNILQCRYIDICFCCFISLYKLFRFISSKSKVYTILLNIYIYILYIWIHMCSTSIQNIHLVLWGGWVSTLISDRFLQHTHTITLKQNKNLTYSLLRP